MSDDEERVRAQQREMEEEAAVGEPPKRLATIVRPALERMQRRRHGLEKPIPLPWEPMRDALGGGLWPGLHVLVGGTGSGKSQWAMQVCLQAARSGTPVLYVALELGEVDVVARMLGSMLDNEHFWSGLYLGTDAEGLDRAKGVVPALEELPIHVDFGEPMGWSYTSLYKKAKAMRAAYPEVDGVAGSRPLLVVLDFLQLMAGPEDQLRERIGKAAYAGRAIARELDAAVVLVSSTARENYGRLEEAGVDKKPPGSFVGLGKESGEVEYAADTVLTLATEPWEEGADGERRPPPDGTHVWVAVAKVRAGTTSWVPLTFDGTHFATRKDVDVNGLLGNLSKKGKKDS